MSDQLYKNNLKKELKCRLLHNQHEVNSLKATIKSFLDCRREENINEKKIGNLLSRLATINKRYPCTEYDVELEKMTKCKLLDLDLITTFKNRDLLAERDTPTIMTEKLNNDEKYRELCDSDLENNEYHDHKIK